jgi:hypothetical protein
MDPHVLREALGLAAGRDLLAGNAARRKRVEDLGGEAGLLRLLTEPLGVMSGVPTMLSRPTFERTSLRPFRLITSEAMPNASSTTAAA